jgi:hypothetical protein
MPLHVQICAGLVELLCRDIYRSKFNGSGARELTFIISGNFVRAGRPSSRRLNNAKDGARVPLSVALNYSLRPSAREPL